MSFAIPHVVVLDRSPPSPRTGQKRDRVMAINRHMWNAKGIKRSLPSRGGGGGAVQDVQQPPHLHKFYQQI